MFQTAVIASEGLGYLYRYPDCNVIRYGLLALNSKLENIRWNFWARAFTFSFQSAGKLAVTLELS